MLLIRKKTISSVIINVTCWAQERTEQRLSIEDTNNEVIF